jgi:hypothetical protein
LSKKDDDRIRQKTLRTMGIKSKLKELISLNTRSQAEIATLTTDTITKNWEASQEYEWNATVKFMSTPEFKALAVEAKNNQEYRISNGYAPKLTIEEFFGNSRLEWEAFVSHITGKKCLEIGSCTSSMLSSWDTTTKRFVIEPLADKVSTWQRENIGFSLYEGLTTYSVGADKYIESLEGIIDGAIYCRNCIDHSPNWMFILSNISAYAAPGCRLLLWNDIFHLDGTDSGHYDLTEDPNDMRRLISALGFVVKREYINTERRDQNWGCFAIKQ